MQVTIHRGLSQIGGCITEIRTETSRVFIDFGQNLPGNGEVTTPEQDKAMVDKIVSQNKREHQAVFYTHAHEDHVGLFDCLPEDMPQYIGEGAREILKKKFYYLYKKDEKTKTDPQDNKRKLEKIGRFHTWERTSKPKHIIIGDISITPFYNCHSIYDSYMFLIEAEGKRIWHMGDYRKHGYIGKGLIPVLKTWAKNIDLLITEGTMLGREDKCIHESIVASKMRRMMQVFKYVVVLASATDIERLASINKAANGAGRRIYVCAGYMDSAMKIFRARESSHVTGGLYDFRQKFYDEKDDLETIKQKGMVMVVGASHLERVKNVCSYLPEEETLLIYSSWDGYYKQPEQIKASPQYKKFRDAFKNVVDIHTSGHADRKTIEEVLQTVKAKRVVCIHKEANQSLLSLNISKSIKDTIIDSDRIEL